MEAVANIRRGIVHVNHKRQPPPPGKASQTAFPGGTGNNYADADSTLTDPSSGPTRAG